MKENYKVYIKVDDNNRVISVNSDVFISDFTEWIYVDEGQGDKYIHAQANYFYNSIMDINGLHNYIFENGTVRETTEEEKEMERQAMPMIEPTVEDMAMAELLLGQVEIQEKQKEQDEVLAAILLNTLGV